MQDQHEIIPILKKCIRQQSLSADEQLLLDAWMAESQSNRTLYGSLVDITQLNEDFLAYASIRHNTKPPVLSLNNRETATVVRMKFRRRYRVAAAAIILAMLVGGWFWFFSNGTKKIVNQESNIAAAEILPARERAVLVMADNKSIDLGASQSGEILKEGNIIVSKNKEGDLEYKTSSTATVTAMHTLKTPRGGFYHLLLGDGTRVWLNAATSLRFPASFSGADRSVELNGEAYFEVAQNKKAPFVVLTALGAVKVLGTHFNIKTYQQEPMTTTLLDGSVLVSQSKAGASKKLVPGQQAIIGWQAPEIDVKQVTAADFIAWRQGIFTFHQASLEQVMNELGRWYDVDVSFSPAVDRTAKYMGEFDRNSQLSWVLSQLSQMSGYTFKLQGRQVTVSR